MTIIRASHSGNTEVDQVVEHLHTAVHSVIQQTPAYETVILGRFNDHHAEWLCSRITKHARRSVYNFGLAYGLIQFVTSATRVLDVDDVSLLNY